MSRIHYLNLLRQYLPFQKLSQSRIAQMRHTIRCPQKHYEGSGWKGPSNVICSNLPPQTVLLRASCPGPRPDGFWICPRLGIYCTWRYKNSLWEAMANSHSPTESRSSSCLPDLEIHSLITALKKVKSERQKEGILGFWISSNQESRDTHICLQTPF